jgi:predicted phage replisome organizer
MADITWIKVATDIFNDQKVKIIETMPEGKTFVLIWIKLLTEAGKANDGGYVHLDDESAYTIEELSVIFREPVDVVERALALLSSKRFKLIELEEDGRIYISKWEKHQNIDGMDRVREQTKKRMAKYRRNKQESDVLRNSNVTVTSRYAIEREKEEELDKELKDSLSIAPEIDKSFVLETLRTYNVAFKGIHELELIESFVGVMGSELIKEAIKQGEKASAKYVYAILQRWHGEGYTSVTDLLYKKPKGGSANDLDQHGGRGKGLKKADGASLVTSQPGRAPWKPRG